MKKILSLAAVAALMAGASPVFAQAASTAASATSSTLSAAEAATIFMPGAIGGNFGAAGAAAAAASSNGGWNQPQLVMNSTNAPSTSTFNDCGIAWSGAIWVVSASSTSESDQCVAQREAIFAANVLGLRDVAFERMCDNEGFRKAVARTAGPQCAQTRQERAMAEAKNPQPVAIAAPQPVAVAFNPNGYGSAAECLTAAYQVHAPTDGCRQYRN